jgi:hypothetical protein
MRSEYSEPSSATMQVLGTAPVNGIGVPASRGGGPRTGATAAEG